MTEAFQKGKDGEDLVAQLAEKAYLKYWCYLNPMDINGDGKEICDVLIIFFDTAIIMSVKNYDLKRNYQRFKKKVIEKSTKQLFGAQRKIKGLKKLVLNNHIQGNISINTETIKHYYNITVSVGEDYEHYEFIDNHGEKGTVNIFNRETAQIIFQELDTIKDLVEYLKARESLLTQNVNNKCFCREKDLLAYFLMNAREFEDEFLENFSEFTKELNGKWKTYLENHAVILKKLEEENSYFIDRMVEKDVLKLKNGEALAKEFMTMNRFERRILANNLYGLVEKHKGKTNFLARSYSEYNGVAFLLIYYPIEKPQEEIDKMLLYAQQLYAYFKNSKRLVLLAASEGVKQWKFCLYLPTVVSGKGVDYLNKLSDNLGWFKTEERIETFIDEYPKQ